MTGTTIGGHLNHGITLGAAGYGSPLTIASTGTVQPTGNGVTGIYAAIADGLIENNGTISGGAGNTSHNGGDGVFLSNNSTIINNNNIVGGALTGGSLAGGIGLYVTGNSMATNTGTIAGGAGIDLGGTGLLLDDSAATNTGMILGGNGGTLVTGSSPATTFGGNGGAAVLMTSATLDNTGKIVGGTAGFNSSDTTASYGGDGVSMSGGMLTNSGSITGGAPANADDGNSKAGTGVADIGGTLTNTGLIAGGGGTAAGVGGIGLVLTDGTATNNGKIAGGYADEIGGVGIMINNASFTNNGLVTGGAVSDTSVQYAGQYGIVGDDGTLINNQSGTIAGADNRAGVVLTNVVLQDSGTITGAASLTGGALTNTGIIEGSAILSDATFANTGTIIGSPGRLTGSFGSYYDYKVNGYAGVLAAGMTSLTNAGAIIGGTGQTSYPNGPGGPLPQSGTGGSGLTAIGVNIMTNTGDIFGGTGGVGKEGYNAHFDGNYAGQGGNGGVGVSLVAVETFTNIGLITGGAGGAGGSGEPGYGSGVGDGGNGGNGATAVYMNGGTLINAGTIEAGAAGAGGAAGSKKATAGTAGTIGDAIVFGTTASTLIADAGAVFIGDIVANKSQHDVLELAGTSTTIFLGIGQTVTGFSDFSFATGAERTIQGSALALANGESIAGFAADDKIIINGVSATSIGVANGKIHLSNKQTTLALNLAGPGAQDVVINASAAGTTIASLPGPITLAAGYTELVTSTGTAAATNIAGGTLDLIAGASLSSGVTFSGTNGELIIGTTTLPTQTITGFLAGDTIQLAGITYATGASAAVTTAGTVTITDAGKTYNLDIAGATVGETDFVFGPGADLTKTANTPAATISTEITASVTLASAAYAQNLLITSTGTVAPNSNAPAIYMVTPGAVLTNNGAVLGSSTYQTSGIVLSATGTVNNAGTISGGVGINLQAGGTIFNSGTITGGTSGDAVQLGTINATVVDEAKGVFNGLVVANKSVTDSLVLAGDAPNVTLSGIGTQFQNFNVIGFATGAERTASGNVAGLASGETIAGFVAHDKLIVTGFSETSVGFASSRIDLISASTTIALNINGAGEHNLLINATSAGTTIAAPAGAVTVTAGFTELVSETGTASATTVHTGGTLAVYGAGSESVDATILKGGVEAVFNGATASATNIAGGTLNLNAGVTVDGGISFSGTGGELILGGTKLPTQIISGFVSGDTIELAGITYATGAKAMVTTAGTVTITDAGKTYNLSIAGAAVGETDFVFGPGSLLTKTAAASTMNFLRPAATAAATPVFTTAVTNTHQQTSIAANTIATPAAATDLLRAIPRNGIQTILLTHSG